MHRSRITARLFVCLLPLALALIVLRPPVLATPPPAAPAEPPAQSPPDHATAAPAAPTLRTQVTQHGNYLLIGNTLGQECAAGTPPPVAGVVGACGANTTDSAPDVFWRADAPAAGQATADTSIAMTQARSTAQLALPPGSTVTHAYLYWAAFLTSGSDPVATLERPGVFSAAITATDSLNFSSRYRSVADVTAIVQTRGAGAYRVGDVTTIDIRDISNSNVFAAWWMVVIYENPAEPLRNLALFDGLDGVSSTTPQNFTVSGFAVPNGVIEASLGVVGLDGDNVTSGDSLIFNGTTLGGDQQNPANNFFNGTRSALGQPVSVAGDLPQLDGTPQSMSGIDLDIVDIAGLLTAGQTSATVAATTSSDVYFLATLITSINTYAAELGGSTKTVVDVNGGALLPGDQLEYTIAVTNTGNETATQTRLQDALPAGVTYVPNSLTIASGANSGPKTDAADADQAEYDAGTRTVTVRLGAQADGQTGGALAVGESTSLRFRATLDPVCQGEVAIANQATLTTVGQLSGQPQQYVTDGNGTAPGAPATIVTVNFRCVTVHKAGPGSGTVTSDSGGLSCGPTCVAVVPASSTLTLTAVSDAGSGFVGWSGAVMTTTNPLALLVQTDRVLTATFALLPTPTPTATPVPPTNTPTPVPPTNTPTSTPVPPTNTPTATPTLPPVGRPVYLPLLGQFQARALATVSGSAIPIQPVTTPGTAFYTTTVTLPNPLPLGGAFYLSGSPTGLTPGLVDDGLIMRVGTTELFRHDYGAASRPIPALVPVPRSALAPWAGQPITVQFVDFHGSVTQASALYLVWQP